MAPHSIYIPMAVAILFVLRYFVWRRAKRLPPGPKAHVLVGNLFDLPQDNAGTVDTYVKWHEDYGVYLALCTRSLF